MVYSYELLNYQSYLQKYFSEKTKSFWIYNSVCKDKCVNVFVVNISITKHDKLYFAANSTKITLHLRFVSENQKMNQLVCINGNKCIPTIEALKGINPRHVIIKQSKYYHIITTISQDNKILLHKYLPFILFIWIGGDSNEWGNARHFLRIPCLIMSEVFF